MEGINKIMTHLWFDKEATDAFLQMKKFDLEALNKAYRGE